MPGYIGALCDGYTVSLATVTVPCTLKGILTWAVIEGPGTMLLGSYLFLNTQTVSVNTAVEEDIAEQSL